MIIIDSSTPRAASQSARIVGEIVLKAEEKSTTRALGNDFGLFRWVLIQWSSEMRCKHF